MVNLPSIDINSLTDADLLHLAAAQGKSEQKSELPDGAIDINKLIDE